MLDLTARAYLPLEEDHVHHDTPPLPGVFMLAIRLAGGVHYNFYIQQTENLRHSLRNLLEENASSIPDIVRAYRRRFRCYFTYVIAERERYRSDLETMLSTSSDPGRNVNPLEEH